ncbi:hypothetical protein F5883DRAFT_100346 [Diaporthe sp. PMI_573]|nr:hypothetical protein F5883DRAFT_100346 [Diaporthaceae sp. PMI_573]
MPIIAPATVAVKALTWVVETFVKISALFDKIESFLARIADKFDNLSLLRTIERPVPQLVRGVVRLFCCSLDIYCEAMKYVRHRLYTWGSIITGTGSLDDKLKEFEDISDSLRDTTLTHTYALTRQVDTRIAGLQEDALRADQNRKIDCLSSLVFDTTYNSLLNRVLNQPYAGSWMLELDDFKRWRDEDVDKLWYFGKR